MKEREYEVIVIGGGHAGSEAALVAARMGAKTALVTLKREAIGRMSCNPAIGGLGKGQLVKEIDALFGEMGLATDDTGIQFRTLNGSKGPAVRSSRAQCDRETYAARILQATLDCENLDIIEAAAGGFELSGNQITGIYTEDGVRIGARAVVLTTGTFLGGLMHVGEQKIRGGRVGEKASYTLSQSIRGLGLAMGRLKTGTPPRLALSSIDFSKLEEQPGEEPIRPFSFRTGTIERKQVSCWITNTTQEMHEHIAENVARSPIFNGQIESSGPRYCPSIEDKVHRFPDKSSHNVFLEPEGYDSNIVYPNGISTSLPAEVQERFVRMIPGLENVEILCHGYAVEYDHVLPTELDQTLRAKPYQGLYLAGQINGTSGYEEAGAQGILAGINAVRFLREQEGVVLRRDEAYIGVMVDDLTTIGVLEPYRMFTSRAEHRLHLREDNADTRLTPLARELGLVADADWRVFEERRERLEKEKARFQKTIAKPTEKNNTWLAGLKSASLQDGVSLSALIRRPELSYSAIQAQFPGETTLPPCEQARVETELKFSGYLKRQREEIARVRKMEEVKIPSSFNYHELQALSIEVRERLSELRPGTLGQAGRIPGVTPAALSVLSIYLRRESRKAA